MLSENAASWIAFFRKFNIDFRRAARCGRHCVLPVEADVGFALATPQSEVLVWGSVDSIMDANAVENSGGEDSLKSIEFWAEPIEDSLPTCITKGRSIKQMSTSTCKLLI